MSSLVVAMLYLGPIKGRDTIKNFSVSDISQISASFAGGLSTGTPLSTTNSDSMTDVFVNGVDPTPMGISAHFLYDTSTGLISFDSDATGSAVVQLIVTIIGVPLIDFKQFVIVS